ncbi:GGDEF domain-containing protein [Sphingomonas sp. FARSPH]|uniref:GGDEF domain-containing protein n=1 Tax=Sphingomonas sp. FARSPH TaxID=2219696 RepID=UPI003FA7E46D
MPAITDPLTGLANRRSFERCCERHLAGGGGGAIATFDIDLFKQVNDRHGHAAGDLVLKRFAALAKGMVREGDVVARLGGEEFAVLLPRANSEQALAVCDRLRDATQKMAVSVGGATIRITVSGGIAPLSADTSLDATMAVADAALYSAKRAGRNVLMMAA